MGGNNFIRLEDQVNPIFIDLIFNLAAGDTVKNKYSYYDQLEYYVNNVLGDNSLVRQFISFGHKFRQCSKIIYPNHPDILKNDSYLIKFLSTFIILQEIYFINDYKLVVNDNTTINHCISKYKFQNQYYQNKFIDNIKYSMKIYIEDLSEQDYCKFIELMSKFKVNFDNTFNTTLNYFSNYKSKIYINSTAKVITDYIEVIFQRYNIPKNNHNFFQFKLDTLIETTSITNNNLEFFEDFKEEFNKFFPELEFCEELKDYIHNKKNPYVVVHGNNFHNIKNENYIFIIIADVFLKLAFFENSNLLANIEHLISIFDDNIKSIVYKNIQEKINLYNLKSIDLNKLKEILIPFQSRLLYLRELLLEELGVRLSKKIQSKTEVNSNLSAEDFKLMLSKKDQEIYELKQELQFLESQLHKDFKTEFFEHDRILTNLFIKLCDFKYNSPLNELYLIGTCKKEASVDDIKSIINNFIFVLKSLNIVPFANSNIGKMIKFYDNEANEEYSVDEKDLKPGLNQGMQIYPGWMYKTKPLILPRIKMKKE